MQQPGVLRGTQVAGCMSPQSGLMSRFCHSLGSVISFGGLVASFVRRIDSSLREQPTLAVLTKAFVIQNETIHQPLRVDSLGWDTFSLASAEIGGIVDTHPMMLLALWPTLLFRMAIPLEMKKQHF